jgi:ubiquitin-like modifier-activating enzyme ATG7
MLTVGQVVQLLVEYGRWIHDMTGDALGYQWDVGSLGGFEKIPPRALKTDDQYVAFVYPSAYAERLEWMLRNLLVLVWCASATISIKLRCWHLL